jgi:hypothetical protein
MSDEMKDVCYGCGKVDVYGSMRDVKDIEFDILCNACWTEKEKELDEIDRQVKGASGIVYDPPMSDTEQYLLNKEREEEHKSYDY